MILEEVFAELGWNVSIRFVTNGEEVMDYLHRRNAYAAPAISAPARADSDGPEHAAHDRR